MKAAVSTDWKTEDLPERRSSVNLDRLFNDQEMDQIKQGLIPEQMEDKWFIYWEKNKLYFHRSWTGNCIYVAHFTDNDNGARMVRADINRDPEQYSETDDEHDGRMISYLIDVLLLHRSADFPRTDESDETNAIKNWQAAGRAMLKPEEE